MVTFFTHHYLLLYHIFHLQHSDMNDEMKTEAMELCVTACEKFAANNEVSAIIMILLALK